MTQTNIVDFQVACVDEVEGVDLTQSRPSLLKSNPGASSLQIPSLKASIAAQTVDVKVPKRHLNLATSRIKLKKQELGQSMSYQKLPAKNSLLSNDNIPSEGTEAVADDAGFATQRNN